MLLTGIQKQILRVYGYHEKWERRDLLSSEKVASWLHINIDTVNNELEKLKHMGLLDVPGEYRRDYAACITALGKKTLKEIGMIPDKE